MKTKVKRLGKSSLSVVLSIMMLLSTLIVGEIGTIEADAANGSSIYAMIGDTSITRLSNESLTAAWNWERYSDSPNFVLFDHYITAGNQPYISVRMKNGVSFRFIRNNNSNYGPDSDGSNIQPNEDYTSGGCRVSAGKNNALNFKDTSIGTGYGTYRVHFDNTTGNKWAWVNRLYQIKTTNDATKGTLTITTDYPEDNKDSSGNVYAQSGESVVFKVEPKSGYTATATLNGTAVTLNNEGSYTHAMGTSSPDFVVTYTEDNTTKYTNTVVENGASGGTFSYSSSLAAGASSTVTVTPPTNYRVYSMTAINESTNAVISTAYSNTITYTMPESDVNVYVTYKSVGGYWVAGDVRALNDSSGTTAAWANPTAIDSYLYYVSNTDSYRDLYLTKDTLFKVKKGNTEYSPNNSGTTITNDGNAQSVSSSNSTNNSLKFTGDSGNYRVHYNSTDHKIWVNSIYQVSISGTTTDAVVGSRYVESGETATVTVYPPSGKYPTVTVGNTTVPMTYNSEDGSYTAETTAGSAAVTFNISYTDITDVTAHTNSYTESGATGGTVTFSPSEGVRKNTYVEMSVTPPSGYTVSSVSLNSGNVTATSSKSGSATVYKYVMPDTNVTAAITYEEKTVADGMIYFDNFNHWSSVKITISGTSVNNRAMTKDDETGLYYFDATEFVNTSNTYTVTFSGDGSKSFTFNSEDNYQKVYTQNRATGETPDEYLNITISSDDIDDYIYFRVNNYAWSNEWYMAYMWKNSNDSTKNAAYPGVRMKKVSGYTNLYAIAYDSNYDRVIFNDGSTGAAETDGSAYKQDGTHYAFNQYNHKSETVSLDSSKKGKVYEPVNNWYRNTEYDVNLSSIESGLTKAEAHYLVRKLSENAFPTADSTSSYIRVYAKTGTIRSVSGAATAENGTYDKYSYYSDINISYCDANGNATETVTDNANSDNYMKKDFDSTLTYTVGNDTHYRLLKADVKRNRYIKVTLTIHDETAQSTYYVRGFNVNGKTYGEYTGKTTDNTYSFIYEVKDETVPIEITPVYFYQDDSNCINFEVEQFDTVESVWGNTVACYAYYVNGSNIRNHAEGKAQATLGGYPGQPLLNHQGIYFTQIPKTDANGGKIKGITLNNYVWDAVHGGDLIGYEAVCGEGSDRSRTARNAQTYDYDDFVALANVSDVDTIIFNFKYRTFNQTGSGGGNYSFAENETLFNTSKYGNEWNGLVDISNVPVDLFGNKVEVSTYKNGAYNNTEAVTSHDNYTRFGGNHHYFNEDFIKSGIGVQDKVYIVSDGYVNYYKTSNSNPLKSNDTDYLGEYATMWYVYTKDDSAAQSSTSTYTLVGKLPPSAFITDFNLESSHFTTKTVNGETILNPNLTGNNIPTKFLQYTKGLGGDDSKYSTGDSARNEMWTQYANIYNAANGMPAVITYESSLTSKGRDGATENLGNRSDGRWYYSRSTDVIPVTADIQVWIKQPDGTYVKDNLTAPDNADTPVASEIVGAAPHFTNDSSYKGTDGNAFTNLNKATVRKASDKDFTFTTEGYKVGSDYTVSNGVATKTTGSTATYTFVGWYLNLDGDNLSEITTNVSADKSMASDSTLVAVYEKVDTTKQTLVVSHELYANAPNLTTKKADPHNGSGTPHIQIVITDENGNTLKTYSDTTGSYQIKVEDEELLKTSTNKVKIILTTETDSATTIYDVYRKRDDGDRYLKSGLNASNTYNWSESNQADADDNYSALTGTVGGALTSKSVTYTYSVFDLFPSGTTVRTLNYYSDPQVKKITVEVKYYDRNTSTDKFGEPTEISSDAKTVTFEAEITDNTLESFVENNLERFKVTENVVDQHYFEFSQYRAVKAIKEFKYYPLLSDAEKVPTNTVADKQKYKYFFSGTYTPAGADTSLPADALNYHTSCYGIPQYDASNCVDFTKEEKDTLNDKGKLDKRQKWVTFYNGDTVINNINFLDDINDEKITEITADNSTNELTDVTKIVIWAFNAPKTYHFTAHYTAETTDTDGNVVYPNFTASNEVTLNDKSTVYIDKTAGAEPISGFYNQRVGSFDDRNLDSSLKNSINGGTEYLKAYGIKSPYFGGSETSIEAAKQATLEGTDTTLKFDGWYIEDSDGFHKLSTQRSYENRIMNDLIIYAGYVPSETTTDSVGVAITENKTDRYIDTGNIEKVRYNTLVNVFGNDVTESDEHIVNAASVYVYLPQYDTDGHYIDWTDENNKAAISEAFADPETKNKIKADVAAHLIKLDNARTNANITDNSVGDYYHTFSTPATEVSIVVNGITISTKGTGAKIDCFDFEIVSGAASSKNHQLTLTNKNRVQFSMIMLADDYDTKPFLAFVAIKYSKDDSSQWYVSDNFVSNLIDTDPSVKKKLNRSDSAEILNSVKSEPQIQIREVFVEDDPVQE